MLIITSEYYEVDEIKKSETFKYKALHINIHSLPAKFEALKLLLCSLHNNGINLDFILICETFLRDENALLYPLNGYNFVYKNRRIKKGGGLPCT